MIAPLAPYASQAAESRGRLHPEPTAAHRSAFRRDCDRIIHCTAFRRLKHKTQVFVFHEGDHYRTRLTHSLEVAQIARALARALRLDEDLAEALALAHDLGHPPFGHAGERALDRCMEGSGGFDHNAQTLRILTALERRYPDFDGLNLTWETLEGLVKHNGPLTDSAGAPAGRHRERGVAGPIMAYNAVQDLQLSLWPGAEAQLAALADDIAYDAHDIDDGLRAGLFTLEEIASVPLPGEILARIRTRHPQIEPSRLAPALVRELIGHMIADVLAETSRRFTALGPASVEDIRAAGRPVAAFSEATAEADRAIKQFLFSRMYRHARVNAIMADAERVLTDLFGVYAADPPADLRRGDLARQRRAIADYIAGMTDRFALVEHARYFDTTPELR